MDKIKSIHYLRGIAALLVVAFHLRGVLNGVYAQSDIGDRLFVSGASGVDIFFIISGFIISLSTVRSEKHNALNYIIKRFFRVYPVLLISLVVFCLIIKTPEVSDLIKSALLLHLNYGMEAPLFGYSLILPAWTLTYEVYFYLIFLISMAISHRFRVLICSAILLAQFIVLQLFFNGELKFSGADSILLTDSSLPFGFLKLMSSPMLLEFIYGMLLFELRHLLKRIPNVKLLAFICVSFFVCAFFSRYRFFYGPVNFGLWAIVLVFGVLAYESQNRIKESSVLNVLGDISYSLYLTHVIVINAIKIHFPEMPIYNMGNGLPKFMFVIAICIVVAYFSHLYIEKPFIKIGRNLLRK